MRPSCTYCARKHLAQALILLQESVQGYPEHYWLAMGHLAEASDELLQAYPALANTIRDQRKKLEEAGPRAGIQIDIMGLIKQVGEAEDGPIRVTSDGNSVTISRPPHLPSAVPVATPTPAPARMPWYGHALPADAPDQERMERLQWIQEDYYVPEGDTIRFCRKLVTLLIRHGALQIQDKSILPHWYNTHWNKTLPDGTALMCRIEPGLSRVVLSSEADLEDLVPKGMSNRVVEMIAKGIPGHRGSGQVLWVQVRNQEGKLVGLPQELAQSLKQQEAAIRAAYQDLHNANLIPASYHLPGILGCLRKDRGLKVGDQGSVPEWARQQIEAVLPPPQAPTGQVVLERIPGTGAVAEKPVCTPCEESRDFREASARWAQEDKVANMTRRVVILAPLSNFTPSYSITSVVLEQCAALATLGPNVRVHLWVMSGVDRSLLPALPKNVEVHAVIPKTMWQQDQVADEEVARIGTALNKALGSVPGLVAVFTHDLLFQSWYVTAAKAIHGLSISAPTGGSGGTKWLHLAHSSVGQRPAQADVAGSPVSFRTNLPDGHFLLALNSADVPYLAAYYKTSQDRVIVCRNGRDPRLLWDMSPSAAEIITRLRLLEAEWVQVFPLSAERASAKGVPRVIDLLHALEKESQIPGARAVLVVVDAHANGKPAQEQKALMKDYAARLGYQGLAFTSDLIPDDAGRGLSKSDVQSLFRVSNLFAFPTISEAGPLVLMEAALAGCQLVLNDSLPALREYAASDDILWARWGSIKEAGSAVDNQALARQILSRNLHRNSRKEALHRHSLEETGHRLRSLLLAAEMTKDG